MVRNWEPKLEKRVLLVLDETKGIRTTTQIRIVEWTGGKGKYLMLEKRDIFFDRDGTEKDGKCRGLQLNDFQKIIYHKDEILRYLMGKM